MADITECAPDWLKERISTFVQWRELSPDGIQYAAKNKWKRLPGQKSIDAGCTVWFIHPVHQKDSGVVQVIE